MPWRRAFRVVLRIIPVLVLVSLGTAILVELVPGDPAVEIVGAQGTPEQYAAVREALGLNLPWYERYLSWISGVFRGDLGQTLIPPVQDVSSQIASHLPVTLELAVLSVLVALAIAIPTGVWSAYRQDKAFDQVASGVSFAMISLPNFLLALALIYVAVFRPETIKVAIGAACALSASVLIWTAVRRGRSTRSPRSPRNLIIAAAVVVAVGILLIVTLPEFPRQGFARIGDEGLSANLRSLALPVLVLGIAEAAQLTRVLRSDMAATLKEDFVLSAKAQGMPVRHILIKEALRPSTFSLVTVAGISFGRLLGGTVIVETIFRLPGMGVLIVDAVQKHEFMVLQASVLIVAALYVVVNAMVDLSYLYLDPRTRNAQS